MQRSWATVDRLSCRRFKDDELAAQLLGLLEGALGRLSSTRPMFRRNRYTRRLAELRQRGLKTAGDLAVRPELQTIIDTDSVLAERWRKEDIADAHEGQLKAERRERKRTVERGRRRRRIERWRKQWAQAFDVPVDRVPDKVGPPTPAALKALLKDPPAWARLKPAEENS